MVGYQAVNDSRKASGLGPAYADNHFFEIEQELLRIHAEMPKPAEIYEIIDTLVDCPSVFKPTEIASREIKCPFDFLWMTVDAQGSWSISIDACTTVDHKDFWANIGRIDQRHYSGIVAIKPLMIGKPDRIRIKVMGTDGQIRIVGRASDILDPDRKAAIGFVDMICIVAGKI